LTAFLAVVLVVSLPWYVAVAWRSPGFAGYFFWKHNVLRFLTPFDHQQPVWFYGPVLLGGLLPGSLLAVSWLRSLGSAKPGATARRCPEQGYLLLAGGWCVLFFSLSGCKLPTYVLPAFPPLALALGYHVAGTRWQSARLTRGVVVMAALLLVAAHYVVVPWYADFHSPMSCAAEVERYCADPGTPVVCYPRNCDSVAFYLGRDDFRSFRSKETAALLDYLRAQPRTVLLFTHRHSPDFLKSVLPAGLELTDLTPVSRSWARTWRTEFCYMGIVRQQPEGS
jgi:hypothetical protein